MRPRTKSSRLAIIAALVYLGFACVTQSSSTVTQHRWWAGLGPVLPHDSFPSECTLCHLENDWQSLRDDFHFDHEKETGVPLLGAHAEARCLRCHNDRGPVAVFTARGCGGCHEDVHTGDLGLQCTTCHRESTWQPVGQIELHAQTRFPLDGVHAMTSCRRCHPGAPVGELLSNRHRMRHLPPRRPRANHQSRGPGLGGPLRPLPHADALAPGGGQVIQVPGSRSAIGGGVNGRRAPGARFRGEGGTSVAAKQSVVAAGGGTRARLSHAKLVAGLAGVLAVSACSGESSNREADATAESCMTCHNGSQQDDYAGPGIENPHPFPEAAAMLCTSCHGGNPDGADVLTSHVPPPPEIGDGALPGRGRARVLQSLDARGHRQVRGLRRRRHHVLRPRLAAVRESGRRARREARPRVRAVPRAPRRERRGQPARAPRPVSSRAPRYSSGVENVIPENRGLYEDTAADVAFRAVQDSDSVIGYRSSRAPSRAWSSSPCSACSAPPAPMPSSRTRSTTRPSSSTIATPMARAITGSPLANLFHEQIAFTCGDCHLGSAGANNRYGDFRSSGCTSCHMPYSLDGRSTSGDPNVPTDEPRNPDQIDEPERPHVRRHLDRRASRRRSPAGKSCRGSTTTPAPVATRAPTARCSSTGASASTRTPTSSTAASIPPSPHRFVDTRDDTRLFDPVVRNHTFNGRNSNQYLLFEDYDGDGRDDTPPDVHYDAGMGCIDCHGSSNDLHGTGLSDGGTSLVSRMEQAVAIRCESCHGGVDSYAETKTGTAYDGTSAELAVDRKGHVLNHVVKEGNGRYWLTSQLTGRAPLRPADSRCGREERAPAPDHARAALRALRRPTRWAETTEARRTASARSRPASPRTASATWTT